MLIGHGYLTVANFDSGCASVSENKTNYVVKSHVEDWYKERALDFRPSDILFKKQWFHDKRCNALWQT